MNNARQVTRKIVLSFSGGCLCLLSLAAPAQQGLLDVFMSDLPSEPRALADRIMDDIVVLRGLEFQRDVAVNNQNREEFERYLARQIDRSLPAGREQAFGRVVEKLGLYRGPRIENAAEMLMSVMASQTAAYYDPEASAFYVLLGDAPPSVLAPMFAHELYHGLQDQHWDLEAYFLDGLETGLDDDQMLARQAVVEGEAMYFMTLWTLRELTGQVPAGFALDLAIQAQTSLDSAAIRQLAGTGGLQESLGQDIQAAVTAMDQIPPFLLETLLGAYMQGMGFVHQVAGSRAAELEALYRRPPQSTEQILHPEKWQAGDAPVVIQFAGFDDSALLDSWTILDSNVLGEFQLRLIFNEFGMTDRAGRAAEGWDGDRYAVYERDNELLLLLYTTWDAAAEAEEFARAYRDLLQRKYDSIGMPMAVAVDGNDVLIVEGGNPDDTMELVELLATADKAELHSGG